MHFDDDLLEQLILDGVVEFAGIDNDTGEMLYSFSPDLADKSPEIFKRVVEMHIGDIHKLWELGFLDMDMTENNPLVNITEQALDIDKIKTLPNELRIVLEQIKLAFNGDNG